MECKEKGCSLASDFLFCSKHLPRYLAWLDQQSEMSRFQKAKNRMLAGEWVG